MPIIDIYTHVLSKGFGDALERVAPHLGSFAGRLRSVTTLHDLDARFRAMDTVDGYRQVISMSNPALEDILRAPAGEDLAQCANDGLADLCDRYPDRFAAFAATKSMFHARSGTVVRAPVTLRNRSFARP